MNKKPLIVVSLCAVVLLVLGSLSNVVGFQTDHSNKNVSETYSNDIIISGTMGENGWYISSVQITFVVPGNYTYFRIDGDDWTLYIGPFVIGSDGIHLLEATSDFEHIYNVTIKIDKTPPVGNLTLKRVGIFMWLLIADVTDITSGIGRVEFYIDNSLIGSVTTSPYECVWIGFMFIILLKYIIYGDEYLPVIKPYDYAGNTPIDSIMLGEYQ